MKKLLCLSLVAILATSCQAQNNDPSVSKEEERTLPQGKWSVNKEVDEQGNIIRYDSIYSWSSSVSSAMALQSIDPDSIMQSMMKRFDAFGMGSPFQSKRSDSIRDPFDSFFSDGFMGDDFFNGFSAMEEMRKRMEAMQHQFKEDVFPQQKPLIPAVPEEQRRKRKQDSLRLRDI